MAKKQNYVVYFLIAIILFLLFKDALYLDDSEELQQTSNNLSSELESIDESVSNTNFSYYYDHMPITFYLNTSNLYKELKREKEKNFRGATERLHEAIPSIIFIETYEPNSADIIFGTSLPIGYVSEFDENSSILTSYIGLMVPVINNNKTRIYIYDSPNNKCKNSDVALHELLHSFGIQHSEYDAGDLMSPFSGDCHSLNIDKKVIDYLKSIYE